MKLFIIILSLISLASFAEETYVLSGQTKHVVDSNGNQESLVTELKLNSCNINVNIVSAPDTKRISITFSNREFEAEGFNIKSNKDGTCTLALIKGKGVR